MDYGFSLSSLIHAGHEAIRVQISALTPSARTALIERSKFQFGHFYAWLRGNDKAIKAHKLDDLLAQLRLHLYANSGKIKCSGARWGRKQKAWNLVDWSKSTSEIAKMMGVTPVSASVARRKFAPKTVGKWKTRKRV
jgi:hypothetical protein